MGMVTGLGSAVGGGQGKKFGDQFQVAQREGMPGPSEGLRDLGVVIGDQPAPHKVQVAPTPPGGERERARPWFWNTNLGE